MCQGAIDTQPLYVQAKAHVLLALRTHCAPHPTAWVLTCMLWASSMMSTISSPCTPSRMVRACSIAVNVCVRKEEEGWGSCTCAYHEHYGLPILQRKHICQAYVYTADGGEGGA